MTMQNDNPCCPVKRRTMTRGDTIVLDVQVLQPASSGQPAAYAPQYVPANITGWFAWFTLKFYYSDLDVQAVLQATSVPASTPSGGGITFTNAANGQMEITGPSIATRNFPDECVKCIYDVKVQTTDTPPRVFTVEQGEYLVYPNATRAGS
jgi:hypothetical protein